MGTADHTLVVWTSKQSQNDGTKAESGFYICKQLYIKPVGVVTHIGIAYPDHILETETGKWVVSKTGGGLDFV